MANVMMPGPQENIKDAKTPTQSKVLVPKAGKPPNLCFIC